MNNTTTHSHPKIPKCFSYDERHEWEPLFYYPIPGIMTKIPNEELIGIKLRCVHNCGVRATAYYKLEEVVEGE